MSLEDLSSIAKRIKDRKHEERHYSNQSIAGGIVQQNGQTKFMWITNSEAKSSSVTSRDITGFARGTEMSGIKHTLQEFGKQYVTVSKNRPIAQTVLRKFGRGILVGNLCYDILASYKWGVAQNSLVDIGTIELGQWKKYTLEQMMALKGSDLTPEERASLEAEFERELEEEGSSYHFIREQAELRNNPFLDENQDKAKFDHAFDNVVEVIDGGPGTGKTTTLIQRLRYLINPLEINEHRVVNGKKELSKQHADIIDMDRKNWIFFSPTPLLCKYLKSNMIYEGLSHVTDNSCVVWEEYLRFTLRDHYQFFGKEFPFDYKKKVFNDKKIFKKKSLSIVDSFSEYYLIQQKKRIEKVATMDCGKFQWNEIGVVIKSICRDLCDANTIADVIKGLHLLENLKTSVTFSSGMSVQLVSDQYTSTLKNETMRLVARIKKNENLYAELLKTVASWEVTEEEDADSLDFESDLEFANQSREVKLNGYIRGLIKNLSLRLIDKSIQIRGRQAIIFELITPYIEDGDFSDLTDAAFFVQHFLPLVRNMEGFLLAPVIRFYKQFRSRELKDSNDKDWYIKTLNFIVVDSKNRYLHPQEQALLLGFINNLLLGIRKCSPSRFKGMNHKYYKAFMECCRPIIGVDEATDYSLLDYYAIASLRHPEISSVTLTGDIMQCLNESGVTDWKQLKNAKIFSKMDVKQLSVSYRQSPKLLSLAKQLYHETTGKDAPYSGLQEDSKKIPSPLWFESNNEEDKAQWIVDRILEVKKAYATIYSKMPSIAVFVSSADEIPTLKENMEDSEDLENAGIDVINCSNGDIDPRKDTVRLFPIDMVKGMEFEVVFFHNLDLIRNTKLIDRYLYIGLSRAAFYMGVTASDDVDANIQKVMPLFKQGGTWSK